MTDLYLYGRSNYFEVKDLDAFKKEMEDFYVQVVTREMYMNGERVEGPEYVALLTPEGQGWPDTRISDERANEVDFVKVVQSHLADGQVAVFITVGYEGFRYLVGDAIAFNNKGEVETLSIDDIYLKAQRLGDKITRAEY